MKSLCIYLKSPQRNFGLDELKSRTRDFCKMKIFLRDLLRIPPYGPNGSQNRPQSTLFESNQSALYPEFFHDLGIEDVLLAQENKLVK